nr:E3 ubiquitin-protein ligase UPL2-like [Tanacetum cinerariifolium]
DEPRNGLAGSAPIDTAFLDALPEKLRFEVVSGRQGQVAQPPNIKPQNDGDIDPEFLALLPPAIRADV